MKLPVANWKMDFTNDEAVSFAKELSKKIKGKTVICAPFTDLSDLARLKLKNIEIGAQNMDYHEKGAYTGEISADMLIASGCKYVMIGHSERRVYYRETDEIVNLKLKACKTLMPILCIGETSEERSKGKTKEVIARQLKTALNGYSGKFIIAYEPIWAISTFPGAVPATPKDAEDAHSFIAESINKLLGKEAADSTLILYGGSVNPSNVRDFVQQKDVDGCLVGGASLDVKSFAEIVNICHSF